MKFWAPSKVKFFLWLALLGRLWTAERRFRHGLQDDATCKLCDQDDETCDHLLLISAAPIRGKSGGRSCRRSVSKTSHHKRACRSLSDWWLHLRLQLRKDKRKGFDSLFALIALGSCGRIAMHGPSVALPCSCPSLLQNRPLFQAICPGSLWARDNR